MTEETPEVRFDKRKQRQERGEIEKRVKTLFIERKEIKGEKRRENEREKREKKRDI